MKQQEDFLPGFKALRSCLSRRVTRSFAQGLPTLACVYCGYNPAMDLMCLMIDAQEASEYDSKIIEPAAVRKNSKQETTPID